jgi:hypothetical protein
MSSLPFISHRLYVAAVKEESGTRPKRSRNQAVIDLPETTSRIAEEEIDGERTMHLAAARALPLSAAAQP